LEFSQGISARSAEGYTVEAGGARIILRSGGFSPLAESGEDVGGSGGELPALPSVALTSRSISLMHFFGRPVLRSPDYEISANAFTSTDGGEHWTLAGEVRFSQADRTEHEIRGERFVFERKSSLLSTTDAIAIAGFSMPEGEATFSADRTVIDLVSRKAVLEGNACFRFGDYRLDAEELQVDLAAGRLSAPNGGYFRLDGSELRAEYVVVAFEEGKAVLEAEELTGRVLLENPKQTLP